MIILKDIPCKYLKSVEVELPRANMVIDPRPNEPHHCPTRLRCIYHDNGTSATLTRTDYDSTTYYESFDFRAYDPATEIVPPFDSMIYTYLGVDGEKTPLDATMIIIHPSVTTIKKGASLMCKKIKKCFMHDGVHTIEEYAFYDCEAMKVIRLSQSLTHIGESAFHQCSSLEAVFLPPSVNQIDSHAFFRCQNLRIFPLPLNIDIFQIRKWMLYDCSNFFQTTQIQEYDYNYDDQDYDKTNRVHQDIIDFYRKQVPPLHKACLDTYVTRQTIQQCINTHGEATASITDHDGMIPLHILVMNPHADICALLACFDLNMSSVFVQDSRGKTPLDYLGEYHEGIEYHTSLVTSLCVHWYAVGRS